MKIRFLAVAHTELDEAYSYYLNESAAIANKFIDDLLHALDLIGRFPEAWPQVGNRIRRCIFRNFPYALVYHLKQNELLVLAVACMHRWPMYWQERITDS